MENMTKIELVELLNVYEGALEEISAIAEREGYDEISEIADSALESEETDSED